MLGAPNPNPLVPGEATLHPSPSEALSPSQAAAMGVGVTVSVGSANTLQAFGLGL